MKLEEADAAQVRPAGSGDAQPIIATLALAFAADPAMRFLLPDASSYHALAPEMIGAVVSTALQHGTLDVVERWHGAAVWFPPSVRVPPTTVQQLLQENDHATRTTPRAPSGARVPADHRAGAGCARPGYAAAAAAPRQQEVQEHKEDRDEAR